MAKTQQQRIIFGLKLRQLRQEQNWNFDELGRQTGISVSYLNEIEKGKKSPGTENLEKLATAFSVSTAHLESDVLPKSLAPLSDLMQSNFLNELPLDLFGIDLQQVVEIIARAPDRVAAFISAMLEIARNYSLREENFYFAALRAYQELRMNYFEEIETAADDFLKINGLDKPGVVSAEALTQILKEKFNYKIEENGLSRYPELQAVRAVFIPRRRRLLLNGRLNERQRTFQLAKELGFAVLNLKDRPSASNQFKINNFEEVLNNYKAAYFAVSVLVNRQNFVEDLRQFFARPTFQPHFLTNLMAKYQASPEIVFQRFNVLSREFNLHKVFFLRFIHHLDTNSFEIDKELHLNRRHEPHASGLNEHYCRRWISLSLLKDLQKTQQITGSSGQMLMGLQRELYKNSGEEYLVFAIAKPGYPTVGRNVGIALGIQLDEESRRIIRFADDPTIQKQVVNVTCQRCDLAGCLERAAQPTVLQNREERRKIHETISRLTGR